MIQKTIIWLMAVLFSVSSVKAQETLNQYLQTAAENNPELESSFNQYLAALEKVDQVGALPDPQLTFAYFIQPVETRLGPQIAKAGLMQMFPWFGTLEAKEQVAASKAKAKYEQFMDDKNKLFYQVKTAYFEYYFAQKAITETEENLKILETFRNLAQIKVESGQTSVVDQLRIEIELEDLKNELEYLKDKKVTLQVTFNNYLNTDAYQSINIPDSLWNSGLAFNKRQLLDSLLVKNNRLKQLAHQEEAWMNQLMVAEKSGKPSFSIGVDYTLIGERTDLSPENNGQDAFIFPKIGITLPLYRKKYNAMIKEASLQQEAVAHKTEAVQNNLESVFEMAYATYEDATRRVDLYAAQTIRAKEAVKLLESEYTTNGKNFEELLRMEKKYLKYQLMEEKALSDKQAAIAFINYLVGDKQVIK